MSPKKATKAALLERISSLENDLADLAMIHETTLEHADTLENDLIELVETLAKTAAGLEVGVFDPTTLHDLVARPDELGQLGRAFQAMGHEVSARDRRLRMLRVVIPAGVALSAQKDFSQLLETVVVEAQKLCNADGGILYLLTEETALSAVIVRYQSLDLKMGGKQGGAVTLDPVPLYVNGKLANDQDPTAHVALARTRVNVADAYSTKEYDFTRIKEFDARITYHSKSFLAIPLTSDDNQVIGVLQLVNARDEANGEIVAFVMDDVIETLVLLASAALSSYRREEALRRQIVELKILIDPELKAKGVAEVTETDYFTRLMANAKGLRKKR